MDCCGMTFFMLLGGVLFVAFSVWGASWLELWRFRRSGEGHRTRTGTPALPRCCTISRQYVWIPPRSGGKSWVTTSTPDEGAVARKGAASI